MRAADQLLSVARRRPLFGPDYGDLPPRARRLRAARANLLDARMLLAFGDVPGAIVSLLNADRWRAAAKVVR